MGSIPGFDLDRAKLDDLLGRFEEGVLTVEEAATELIPLLEKERKKALQKGEIELARDIVGMLVALEGYVNRRIDLYGNVIVHDSVSAKKISNS